MSQFKTQALPLVGGDVKKHSICDECFAVDYPDKDPLKQTDIVQPCCFCDRKHSSGIYVKVDPESSRLLCKKRH